MTSGPAPRAAAGWSRWYRRALPAYWVFLFTTTHLPKLSFGEDAPRWTDKAAHVSGYALLAFLVWRFVESFAAPVSSQFAWRVLLLIAVYAAVDEWLQAFVGRGPDVADWAWDMVGSAAALGLMEAQRRRAAAEPAEV